MCGKQTGFADYKQSASEARIKCEKSLSEMKIMVL
jgi:hypothetical protein